MTSIMEGLRTLYTHTGRRTDWRRLVEEIVPDFIGTDDRPLSGREEQWTLFTGYRVQLATESHNWGEAERLQRMDMDWNRYRAEILLDQPTEELSHTEKYKLRLLAVSMEHLGRLQRDIGNVECVQTLKDAIPICQKLGDNAEEAIISLALGTAYKNLPAIRDLDESEHWYQRSLELRAKGDRIGLAECYSQLGAVEFEKYKDAISSKQSDEKLLAHLNAAANWYHLALEIEPPDMPRDLAIDHNALGMIYASGDELERALEHFNEAAKCFELVDDLYNAGGTHFNVAIMFVDNGRLSDSLHYAQAALRNFKSYGGRAGEDEEETRKLIGMIEQAIEESKK